MLQLILIGGIAVVIVILVRRAEQSRRSEIQAVSLQLGLEFSEQDESVLNRVSFLNSLQRFGHKSASCVLRGRYRSREVVVFDFKCRSSGKKRSTLHFAMYVAILDSQYPELLISRENLLTRMADFVGFSDIEFSDDEFSRKFNVKSSSENFARQFCSSEMQNFLMRLEEMPDFEIEKNVLSLCFRGKNKAESVTRNLQLLMAFCDRVPQSSIR